MEKKMADEIIIYLARDGERNGKADGDLFCFEVKPDYHIKSPVDKKFRLCEWWASKSLHYRLPHLWCPTIKNGECRKAKIVLESEDE
jgi:hypothetical protein